TVAAMHLAEPPLDLTVKHDAACWAAQLDATTLPTGTLRRTIGGAISDLPGYADGAWWVQDVAASLPARLLGTLANQSVVELCAAAARKTAPLASGGARVTAVDIAGDRLLLLGENLARLRLDADLVEANATQWQPSSPAPFVLLDAPCTATGTIRRHPDIAH